MVERLDLSDNTVIAEEIVKQYEKYHSMRNKGALMDVLKFISILLVMSFFLKVILDYLKLSSPEPGILYLFMIVFLTSIFVLPRVIIIAVILYRTKHIRLILELFDEVAGLIWIGLIPTIIIYTDNKNFSLAELLLVILVVILVVEISLNVFLTRKPIFNTDMIASYWSNILSQQSLILSDKNDGYSQRPIFSSILQLKENLPLENNFDVTVLNYIKFLSRAGEVIGWKRKENRIIYFPRVLIEYPRGITHLFSSIRLLQKILRLKSLTSITINLKSDEIALFVTPDDYKLLNNVTFHLFCLEFLERTKRSIDAFMKNDLTKSYTLLYPIDPEVKNFIGNIQKNNFFTIKNQQQHGIDRPTFLLIPGIVEMTFGMGFAMILGFLLFFVGAASIGVILNVLFHNTDYEHLNIFYVSIPVLLLFIGSCIVYKEGLELLNMKTWAYVASFITFIVLLLVSILLIPILALNLNGLLIGISVIVFALLTIIYLSKIRNRFDFSHLFVSRFSKTNNTRTKSYK